MNSNNQHSSIETGKFFASPSEPSVLSLKAEDILSVSGDNWSCGEPLLAQRITFDFTPSEEDNEIIQKKCCEFWEFIKNHPQLDILKRVPNYDIMKKSSISSEQVSNGTTITNEKFITKDKTAVSMLELVEEKGLIDRAFEGNMPRSYCSMGSNIYTASDSLQVRMAQDKTAIHSIQSQSFAYLSVNYEGTDTLSKNKKTSYPPVAVKKMCIKLHEWDKEHPKSMEPPGHPPMY